MDGAVQPHNHKAQAVWNSPGGRYDEISRSIADAIEHAIERLQPRSGEKILDLATGTGWGSRVLAQRFAASRSRAPTSPTKCWSTPERRRRR
jgi:ubiquinone/menaquinone biosynthesis C-methylase UbiE